MSVVQKWRDIIGVIEIVAGSFLILPQIITFTIILFLSKSIPTDILSQTVMSSSAIFGLTSHTHSSYGSSNVVDTFGGFFLLNGFFWIGIIILINGIWKIRSNRYLNNPK